MCDVLSIEERLDELIPDFVSDHEESSSEWRSQGIDGDLLVYAEQRVAHRCGKCLSAGRFRHRKQGIKFCDKCNGTGWHGIDPCLPTVCRPGSYGKIAVLTQRYALGLQSFNEADSNS